MTQEIANRDVALATFSREQVDLLKRTIAKDHTDDELKLFIAYCKSRGLDPFAREVYSVKRAGKVTFQMGIDGLRAKADETGDYGGQEVFWCGQDGAWVDVWLKPEPPAAAKVIIYRRGTDKPFVGLAKWEEYKPADNDFMWKKMPANQLAKCAEALALRKAFPKKLGGLYATEEMRQSDSVQAPIVMPQAAASFDERTGEVFEEGIDEPPQETPPPAPAASRRLSPKQQAYLFGLAKKKGWTEADIKAYTTRFFKKPDPTQISSGELDVVLRHLQTIPDVSQPE